MEIVGADQTEQDAQMLETLPREIKTVGMPNKRAVAQRAAMQVAHVSTLPELTRLLLEARAR